jgi:hypothetical protein
VTAQEWLQVAWLALNAALLVGCSFEIDRWREVHHER